MVPQNLPVAKNVQEPWRKQESNWDWNGTERDQSEAVVKYAYKDGWYESTWVWRGNTDSSL